MDTTNAKGERQMNLTCFYCEDFHGIEDCCDPAKTEMVIVSLKKRALNLEASIPYGYRLENEKIIPSEAEQRVLGLVRKYRLAGLSLEQIAKVLAEEGARKSIQPDTTQASTPDE